MARVIPDEIIENQKRWQRWSGRWTLANTLMGVVAALLSTLIAANARLSFLSPGTIIGCSMVVARLPADNAECRAEGEGICRGRPRT